MIFIMFVPCRTGWLSKTIRQAEESKDDVTEVFMLKIKFCQISCHNTLLICLSLVILIKHLSC